MLSPGIRFLAVAIVHFALYVGFIVFIISQTGTNTLLRLPEWPTYAFLVFGIAWQTFGKHLHTRIKDKQAAKALGARLVPKDNGRWLGNFDVVLEMLEQWQKGYPGDGLTERVNRHGQIYDFNTLWETNLFTTCPEHIQIVLATDFPNYVKGERFQEAMASMLGVGVFNADGDMWKFHRTMTRPFFTRDRISHFELFNRHSDSVIKQMKARLREGYAVDFQDLMNRFTLDSATEFLFGSCVEVLSAELPYPHTSNLPFSQTHISAKAKRALEFAVAFADVQEVVSHRARVGWSWPLWEFWKDESKEPMRIVNDYVEPIIKHALEKHRAKGGDDHHHQEKETVIEEDETLLDHLVNMTTDPKILKDETLNIMLAGRDTTAATLTFIVYFLAKYPQVMARLRGEIMSKLGQDRRPTYEDIREMKYLRAVINETLRLYPVVPFNIRQSVNAAVWPSPDPNEKPLYIPPDTKFSYSVFMMHRRTDLWGPDAEEFDPDRFLDERVKKYLTLRPFIFLPFNAGPRICLGQQFAYNEMSFILIRLLQSFSSFTQDIGATPPEGIPPVEWRKFPGRKGIETFWPKMNLTMYAAGGLWLRAQEAAEI